MVLTTTEAAKKYNVSKAWFEKQRWLGEGPPYMKVGRNVRYDPQELEDYFRKAGHQAA